jgi:hypothetical protein
MTTNEAAERLDMVKLTAGVHDWFCGSSRHNGRRPYIGWACERGARRIFDVYSDQTADWSLLQKMLDEKAVR